MELLLILIAALLVAILITLLGAWHLIGIGAVMLIALGIRGVTQLVHIAIVLAVFAAGAAALWLVYRVISAWSARHPKIAVPIRRITRRVLVALAVAAITIWALFMAFGSALWMGGYWENNPSIILMGSYCIELGSFPPLFLFLMKWMKRNWCRAYMNSPTENDHSFPGTIPGPGGASNEASSNT